MKRQPLELWDQFDTRQQRAIILVGVLALVMVVVIIWRSFRADWALLYGGLDAETAGSLVRELKDRGVAYRLEQQGTAVMVHEDQLYELRLQLASEGLPARGGVGFEIFDRSSLPGTEFSNQVNLQRALQGELSSSMNCLEEVAASRVHLVMPEESLFSEPTEEASASVVLTLEQGRRLSQQQVQALVHLVAASVAGLEPQGVTIVDTRGSVLASGEKEPGRALSADQLEITGEFERNVTEGLQSMLDAAIGQHKSVVQVQAELNFDSEQRRSELYTGPDGQPAGLKSEHITEETYDSNPEQTGGEAGVSANIFGTQAGRDNGQGKYLSREQSREYELSKEVVEKTIGGSSISRMSVAVVVDESIEEQNLRGVEQLVAAACGCDESRGDEVVVERMPLAAKKVAEEAVKEAEAARKSRSRQKLFTLLARYGSTLAMVIVFGAVMLVVSRRMKPMVADGAEPDAQKMPEAPDEDQPALGDGPDSVEEAVDIGQQLEITGDEESTEQEPSDEELIETVRTMTRDRLESVAQHIEEMVRGNG